MNRWVHDAVQALERDAACAIITIARVVGSAPRAPGTRMVVTRCGMVGTIGGGALEYRAVQRARQHLLLSNHRGGGRELLRLTLGPVTAKDGLGQCCGGVVWLLLETLTAPLPHWLQRLAAVPGCDRASAPIAMATCCAGDADEGHLLLDADAKPSGSLGSVDADRQALHELQQLTTGSVVLNDAGAGPLLLEDLTRVSPTLVLFGAGHVGSALINVLQPLELPIRWIDSRPGMLPKPLPAGVQGITACAPEAEVVAAPAGSLFLVMTHQHVLDYRLVVKIFERGDAQLCGLIGSASKRLKAERELRRAGFSATRIARQLRCPIGIGGIRSKQPAAIAIAVAAQLLMLIDARASVSDGDAASDQSDDQRRHAVLDNPASRPRAIAVAFEPEVLAKSSTDPAIDHEYRQ